MVTAASALGAPAMKHEANMAASGDPKTFQVGNQAYHFEIPAAQPATAKGDSTSTGPVSQQQASLAALFWAKNFYNANNLTVDSIHYEDAPNPHYLAHLTGEVGGARQPLYAAVLPDGKIARPVAGPAMEDRSSMKKEKMKGMGHHHRAMKKDM